VSVTVGSGAGTTTAAGLAWPEGSPGALQGAAGRLGNAADVLRSTSDGLAAAAGGAGGWQGQAAEAFRSALAAERSELAGGAGALAQAAGAVRRLADVVDEAQEEIRRLDRQVREAEDAADRAEARAAVLSAAAAAAGLALDLAGSDAPTGLSTAAGDADADAASAGATAGDARAHAVQTRQRAERRAEELCDDVRAADRATAGAVDAAAAAAPMGGRFPGAPGPSMGFARRVLANIPVDQWRDLAYHRAGIDGEAWDPRRGLLANDDTVRRVYAAYSRLFDEHPELQWAGMAALVGPTFYAGWQDMYTARHVADDGQRQKYLRELVGLPTGPDWFYDAQDVLLDVPGGMPFGLIEDLSSEELEHFEREFLDMQKQIFDDLAWQHEAYALGGVPLMRELAARGALDLRTVRYWEDVGSGEPGRVSAGNLELLRREQSLVIQDDYERIRKHHTPVGEVFTYALGAVAENPIPGGRSYRGFDGVSVPIVMPGLPFPQAHEVRLPTGNLARYDDRWRWIERDMLPAYQQLLATDPARAHALARVPVEQRAEEFRKLPLPYPR
jgi:uncharacterized protein YukE